MKTIGLIGGMSWESTAAYYEMINEEVKTRLGGLHSAKCVLYSVDFAEIEGFQSNGQWEEAGKIIEKAAQSLERAGADFIVICTNTMHNVIDLIEDAIHIPILHIADAAADAIHKAGIQKVGLLGTKYTMELDFYKKKMQEHQIELIIPEEEDRVKINEVIFDELCVGELKEDSRTAFLEIIDRLAEQGAQGMILGCTEIGLLIKQEHTDISLFDTAVIHAKAAVDRALEA